MKTSISWTKFKTKLISSIMKTAMVGILIAGSIFTAVSAHGAVMAVGTTVSINLINYGGHSTAIDNSIINAHPAFIVDNSPAGPWKGTANISTFTAAGIKYFEYLDGGYEGTTARSIPNDVTSNLNYITAAANAGAYGIFLDEVSSNPSSTSLSYLQQIYNKAHSLGLKVVFNTGVDSWSDSLMSYCDYLNSSEVWNNAPLTASQTKWASRTWLLTEGINDATSAANLTKEAWAKGILAEYACSSYGSIPSWLPSYYSLISNSSPTSALSITTGALNNGTVGTTYSQILTATGGTTPYTWSIASGTLPAGLSLSSSGIISGTPTTVGSVSVTFKVTDSNNATATQSATITINNAALSITTGALNSGTVGTTYSQTLTATGGTTPYTWLIASGALPAGLSLSSSGIISGTPTTVGSVSVTFKVTDSNSATATQSATITINNAALSIATGVLNNGTVGTAFSQTLTATGGTTPYTWTIAAGTLPAGLSLSSSGIISGTPTTAGSTSVTFKVTDNKSATATQSATITINNAALNITTSALNNGTVGTACSQTLTATGGTTPYTWTIAAGTLPAGLSLSSSGIISGTPTTAGSTSGTFKVTDNKSATATQSMTITINNAAPSITTGVLNNGTVGTAFSQTLTATGGTTPYTWSIASGTLPAGLSLGSSGIISGTPTTAGSASVTFKVTDNKSVTVTKLLSIMINPATTAAGNTTGVVANTPASSGGANEYNFYLKITSTTVSGIAVGQQVWCAANTTDFPIY